MMSAQQTNVVDVGGVAVPVSDQDRVLRFYVDTLGFEVRLDVPMGDGGRRGAERVSCGTGD